MKIWINGKIKAASAAVIPAQDRGFLYGEGAFETMRSYGGRVFMLDGHLERLSGALGLIGIRRRYPEAVIKKAVYACLAANKLKDAYLRITVTKGPGGTGFSCKKSVAANVVIMAKRYSGYPAKAYSGGISAATSRIRQNEHSPLSGIKSLNYLSYIIARRHAVEKGFDEALLLNTSGFVSEFASGNIFLVKNKSIVTPSADSGILPGITRAAVMKIAKKCPPFTLEERKVRYAELLRSDEVFLTNSLAGIVPVVKIGSSRIGKGVPGKTATMLREKYLNMVKNVS